MNVTDWMSVLLYASFTLALGHMLVCILGFKTGSGVQQPAAWFIAGQIMLSLSLLETAWLPLRLTAVFVGLGALLLAFWIWRFSRRAIGQPRGLVMMGLGVLAILLLFPQVIFYIQRTPVIEWDARSIWFFHAKGLFHHGGVSPAFFTLPDVMDIHPDYPLLLPAQAAWVAFFGREWNEFSVKAFLLFNFTAWFGLMVHTWRRVGASRWVAIIGTAFFMSVETYGYVNGYADLHCIMPLVLATVLLSSPRRLDEAPLWILLVAYAAGMKNEGMVFAYLLTIPVAAMAFRPIWRAPTPSRERPWTPSALAAWGGLLLLAPTLLWAGIKASYGLTNDLTLGQRLLDPVLVLTLLNERVMTILAYGYKIAGLLRFMTRLNAWHLLVMTLVLILVRLAFKPARRSVWPAWSGLALWLALGVSLGVIGTTYLLTPHDLSWHIHHSAGRLMLLPFLILVALLWRSLIGVLAIREPVSQDTE